MNLTKAIIHTLDSDLKTMILSQQPLNLNQSPAVEIYLEKLAKGLLNSSGTSKTELGAKSKLYSIINSQFNFLETSKEIASTWFDMILHSSDYQSLNLVILQMDTEESSYLLMIEVPNKEGYLKITHNQTHTENTIVFNQAILPSTFSSVRNAYSLSLSSGELMVKCDLKHQDFIEEYLDCELRPTTKEALKIVDAMVHHISTLRDEEPLNNTIKMRNLVTDHAEIYDEIESIQIIKEVFEELDDNEQSMINTSFEHHRIPEFLNLKDMSKMAMVKRQRIKTESGIEIVLPLDSVNVDDMIDIRTDETGRVSIQLKNIGKIIED
ncbi:nucleoid-associated protein [Erysipelothrix sp. HDW6A]|uniref:nucleoid-associated protein n=1 Tax=Erysipelothrix sp. HDW6A TaxID=2714928 RepID=UPI00140E8ACC|nr:nucleoid-associated protein [Erysipelothrix sp. HDW6A]QIK57536.1 nucleoid-associated protein [Erysipelothrix sp. HDW6A]